MTLANFAFPMGARKITRLLIGLFDSIPAVHSLACALASDDEELIRAIWVRTPDEVRTQCMMPIWIRAWKRWLMAGGVELFARWRRLDSN
jgi:hypothetical protein